jgi:hypothetical protein
MMHSRRFLSLLALVLLVAARAVAADDPEAKALVVRLRDSAPKVTVTADATLTSGGSWVRQIKLSHKPMGDERATLLEVTAPGDVAGSRYLLFERTHGADRQFMYLPALTSRIIEVTDEARREPFLGSDFYVADLIAPDVDSFTYAFVGDEEIHGHACRLVEATVRPGAKAPYPRTIFAIDPEALVVWRGQAFDDKGALFKEWTLEKLETIDDHPTPVEQRMRNVQAGSESTLVLRNVHYGVDLPDSTFSKQRLSR